MNDHRQIKKVDVSCIIPSSKRTSSSNCNDDILRSSKLDASNATDGESKYHWSDYVERTCNEICSTLSVFREKCVTNPEGPNSHFSLSLSDFQSKDGNLATYSSELHLSSVSRRDNGFYQCVAYSAQLAPVQSKMAPITVLGWFYSYGCCICH